MLQTGIVWFNVCKDFFSFLKVEISWKVSFSSYLLNGRLRMDRSLNKHWVEGSVGEKLKGV